jgi:RND family efflux transporter MFP subunit
MNNHVMKFYTITLLVFWISSAAFAAPSDKPISVTVTKVVEKDLREELPLVATIEPIRLSELSPKIDGVIAEVFVQEGDWVKAGDKILSLDPVIAEIEVNSAKAKVSEAHARHKDALRQKKEHLKLIKHKAVSSTSMASALADEEAASAVISLQQAELERYKEILSRHVLTAPFSGIISNKLIEAGEWVKADSTVVTLVSLDQVRLRASLPQRYFGQIELDSPARISLNALPGETIIGEAVKLVAMGNQSTRSFPILIELDNTQHRLAPGMSARLFVQLKGTKSKSLLVPRDTVVLSADGTRKVWQIIEKDGSYTVKSVNLITGRTQGELVEVLDSTLNAGDRIVLLGNENLRPGQAVKLLEKP